MNRQRRQHNNVRKVNKFDHCLFICLNSAKNNLFLYYIKEFINNRTKTYYIVYNKFIQ